MRRECGCRLAAELEESRRLAAEYESAAARAEQSSTEYREQLIQQQGSQTQPNSVELETELAQQRAKLEKAALEGQRLAADAAEKTSRCAELEAQIKTVGEVMAAMGSASEKIAKEHSAAARIARQWHRRHTNRVLRDVRKSCAAQLEQSRERERKLALAPSASSGALSAASGLQSPDGSPLNEPVYSRLLGDASLATAEGSKRASFSGNSSPSLDSPSSSASAEAAGGPGTSWLHGAGNSTPSAPSDTAAIVAQQSWSPTARTGAGSSHDVGGAKLTPQAIALAQQVAEAELKVALAERHNQQARLEHRRAQHEVARQRRFSPGGRRTPSTTQPTSSSKLDSKGRSSGMPNRHGSPASDRRRRHVSPVAFQDQRSDRKQAKQFLRRGGGSGGGRITESAGLVMPNKEERARIFRRMDYNGNGVLSLAEIDKAVVELWPQLNNKQVLMRAYQAADVNGDGLIGRREFRLLLQYVLYFHRLWDRFDAIDTDHDHRLTLSEFTNGCSLVGLKMGVAEAGREFQAIDENSGGLVLFDEFCVWCARKAVLGADVDPYKYAKRTQKKHGQGRLGERDSSPDSMSTSVEEKLAAAAPTAADATAESTTRIRSSSSTLAPTPPKGTPPKPFLPVQNRTEDGLAALTMPNKEERARIFRRMDYNGNGVLSLAEIDKAVVELWPQLNNKQVLMRAYQAADVNGDGLIGRREFRLLLQYVLYFHRLWDRFDAIDTDHDHRLTLSEFTNGCSLLGIPVADNEAANVFGEMDTDNGGVVRFTEFCVWCARHTVANEHRQQQGSTAAHSSTVQARAPGSPSVSMSPLGSGAVSLGQEPRQRGRYGEYRRVKKNDDATKAPVATSNALEHEKERPTGTAGMVKDNRGASRGSSTSQDEEAAQYVAAERLAAAATDPNISPSALVQAYLEATDTLADPKSSAMLYYKRLLPQNFQC
eukprot:COSAG02_NODE_1478_length_12404_cov_353.335067_7_plen_941_part_00